jgi:hypothetical protein
MAGRDDVCWTYMSPPQSREQTMVRASYRDLGRIMSLCALASALIGCEGKQPWREPGPREVFEQFLMLVLRGEDAAAWAMIAPADREALLKAREELVKRVGEEVAGPPERMLVVGDLDNEYDFKRIEVMDKLEQAPAEGQVIKLKLVYLDGREGYAQLIWQQERWFVDLPLEGSAPKAAPEG